DSIEVRGGEAALILGLQEGVRLRGGVLDQPVEVGGEDCWHPATSHTRRQNPMPEGGSAAANLPFYVGAPIRRIRIDGLEEGRVLTRMAVGGLPTLRVEVLADPLHPQRVYGIDFSSRQGGVPAEQPGLEVDDHVVAGRDPGSGRAPGPDEP